MKWVLMFSWLIYYLKTISINFARNMKIFFVKKLIKSFENYIQLVCPIISTVEYQVGFFIITSKLFLKENNQIF